MWTNFFYVSWTGEPVQVKSGYQHGSGLYRLEFFLSVQKCLVIFWTTLADVYHHASIIRIFLSFSFAPYLCFFSSKPEQLRYKSDSYLVLQRASKVFSYIILLTNWITLRINRRNYIYWEIFRQHWCSSLETILNRDLKISFPKEVSWS